MKLRTALLAATVLAAPLAVAHADPISGVYVAGGAGMNLINNEKYTTSYATTPTPTEGSVDYHFDGGFVGLGSIGWGFGNGFRLEAEGVYTENNLHDVSGVHVHSREEKFGGFVNALYDFNIGMPASPYLGVGVGYLEDKLPAYTIGAYNFSGDKGSVAFQGIAGLAFDIAPVPGLQVTAEYRFMDLASERTYTGSYNTGDGLLNASTRSSAQYNHSLLVGLRYAFNMTPPPPAPAPAPAPVAAPAPAPARTYLVFFDWDRADLTDRARGIIKEAATASTKVQLVKIEVNGHADLSGTPQYNQKLSERRAQAVAAELIRDGVNQASIDLHAYGDTKPLVPTARGVREPQNRRVEIIFR